MGGTYGTSALGGDVLAQKVWLNCGDTIKYVTSAKPANYTTNSTTVTVNGGTKSEVYINNQLLGRAYGASATAKNSGYDGSIYTVILCNSDNSNSVTHEVHYHTDACYNACTASLHKSKEEYCDHCDYCDMCPGGCEDEDGTCRSRYNIYCSAGHSHGSKSSSSKASDYISGRGNKCGVTTLTCGYGNAVLKTTGSPAKPACVGMTLQTNTNTGSGYFTIQLCEVLNLYNNNTLVKVPYFNDYKYNVVVVNDTVVYCKYN